MVRHKVEYLTDTQEWILRHIRAAITDQGEAPTVAEPGRPRGIRLA